MAVGSEGIITFPSLHAALAVIVAAVLWPIPVLRWPVLGVNALMLAATPIDGSHYFIDVVAGIVLALACLTAARAMARRFADDGTSRRVNHLIRSTPRLHMPLSD
jgi:membrane-associated phospholipid phosphatase